MKKIITFSFLSVFVGAALSLLLGECFVRLFIDEWKVLKPNLYFFEDDLLYSDKEPHVKHSEIPEKLYDLIPSQKALCLNCSTDKIVFSTNALGFRDHEERKTSKPADVYRIIVVGSSNTFGPTVKDEETYPALLEKELNKQKNKKYEVWNLGICAYVPSQKAAYAQWAIQHFHPDLIIYQEANTGRRPFASYDRSASELFSKEPSLYLENYPFPFYGKSKQSCLPFASIVMDEKCDEDFQDKLIWRTHRWGVYHSKFYRFILASSYRLEKRLYQSNLDQSIFRERELNRYSFFPDRLSYQALDKFLKNVNLPVLIFSPTWNEDQGCQSWGTSRQWKGRDYYFARPCQLPAGSEYREIHPPAYVYELYARELAKVVQEIRIKTNK